MGDAASPAPPPPKPIIIVKRKGSGGHGGHHGGAWKVAYADFVTAMMALFIVLWLMNSDKEVQESVSAYFNNPSGPGKLMGTAAAGAGNSIDVQKEEMGKLREKIQQALLTVPNFREMKDHVEITITSDGLRIELLETEAGMFFESGRASPTESGSGLLTRMAEELGKLPNAVVIEGHTDAKPYADGVTYSNWELSADRANAARKIMQAHGLREEQITQVRGFAQRQLRHPEDPEHASNRRVSVIVQYQPTDGAERASGGEGQNGEGQKGEAQKGAGQKSEPQKREPLKGEGQKGEPPAKAAEAQGKAAPHEGAPAKH